MSNGKTIPASVIEKLADINKLTEEMTDRRNKFEIEQSKTNELIQLIQRDICLELDFAIKGDEQDEANS